MNNIVIYISIFCIVSILGHIFERICFNKNKHGILYKKTGINAVLPIYGIGAIIIILIFNNLQLYFRSNIIITIVLITFLIGMYECIQGRISNYLHKKQTWSYHDHIYPMCNNYVSAESIGLWLILIIISTTILIPIINKNYLS
jgi:uncharacterized membrane protein